ncbi:MAG: amidohydrolase family protein, partial [Cellulomonas sp.]|nr:amidohydrolase family protein [Cellulomonas sp.]
MTRPGTVLRGDAVVPQGVIRDAGVVLVADRVAWVGPAEEVPAPWVAPPPTGVLLLPGLVDVHNHGGGGASFPDAAAPDEVRTACDEHLRHGTTSLVASLVTAPPAVLVERVARLAADQRLTGIHVEGPFLSAARAGAQHPDDMCAGDPRLVDQLVAAAGG